MKQYVLAALLGYSCAQYNPMCSTDAECETKAAEFPDDMPAF